MSRLDECLQRAIDAGEVDATRAQLAQERFRELIQRYEMSGFDAASARIEAGNEVIESIIREAKSRRHATLRQLDRMAKNEARYATAHADDPDLIIRDVEQADRERQALEQSFMANISDFLAAFRTNVVGSVRNRAYLQEVVRELHGQATGNAAAQGVAKAVTDTFERARVLFNAQGGDIGQLADFGLPHRHDGNRIAAAGFDAWAADVFTKLDWHRMVDFTTGKPFTATPGGRPNKAAANRLLREVFDSITTGGWDDRFPSMGMGGQKSAANMRAEHRVLHFRDGDAWMAYNEAFGSANPFDAIVQHLSGMARDIAAMRNFGPNPHAGLRHAAQVMERAARTATDLNGKAHVKRIETVQAKATKAQVMLDMVTGRANTPANAGWARFFAGTRNLLTGAQLGGAILSSTTDWGSMALAARAVSLNPGSTWNRTVQTLVRGATPQQARDMGYIFDTWFNTGAGYARFMGDIWSPEITSRITNTVLRVSLLNFWTDRARFGVAMAFGSDLAQVAGKRFDELDEPLRRFMADNNIGAADWDAVRDAGAMFTDPTGGRHISAEWFRRHTSLPPDQAEDIATRWGALVRAHQEFAIPTASLRGRATIIADSKPGSPGGELLRSTAMYKSFMLSVLFNQLRRIGQIDGIPNRAWYVARYIAVMTALGGVAIQLKETAKGRDPRDMNPMENPAFWVAALLQGGGLGIFGDFFGATTSRAGGGLAETAAGPVVGLGSDIGRAVSSNISRAGEGKDILLGRDVVNLARRYNPAASLWYTRLAMDRLVWDQMQQILDPEAEDLWRRQEGTQRKSFGNASWWRRGQTSPDRGPNLSAIAGGTP